ncbi:hypothetical protein SAMN05421759_1214 [Roseivivax lentus]|uniref:Uncharacterized protein n=1 Tax=Roseivivax lentus TaxID=633194 RepID=A0A1N7PVP2_9RHOB|nr:hypothetical protein SAMN05421759_1214 [Roseivivax lentus]
MAFTTLLFAVATVLSPAPDRPACMATDADGPVLHCCQLSNGLTCCSESLDSDGTITGCDCSE